jgi:hypothetical protein
MKIIYRVLSILLVIIVLYLVSYNSSIDNESRIYDYGERSYIYDVYMNIGFTSTNFFHGLGDKGIFDLIDDKVLPVAGPNAHNILLDGLVRYGWLFFIVEILVLSLILFKVFMVPKKYLKLGIGLFSIWFISGFSECLFFWNLFSPFFGIFIAISILYINLYDDKFDNIAI